MSSRSSIRAGLGAAAKGIGLGLAAYVVYAVSAWYRYGRLQPASEEADPTLDRFMPVYEIAERHHVRVAAPAGITFAAETDLDLNKSALIRAIFKGRELILGSRPDRATQSQPLLEQTKALGWGVLAEIPGREIVMGAVTQPWVADVVFRPIPPQEFASFREPGYVKIAWTLRADPAGPFASVARTETRAVATDLAARRKFRRYWSLLSPGIILIRSIGVGLVKKDAERRAHAPGQAVGPPGQVR